VVLSGSAFGAVSTGGTAFSPVTTIVAGTNTFQTSMEIDLTQFDGDPTTISWQMLCGNVSS
jgi:hypothetical protein